jgi:hypothetical protein
VTGRDGTNGAIKTESIKAAIELAEGSTADFERILTIERIYQEKKK